LDGTPSDLRVVQPLGFGLDEKALEAVSKWRFAPALVNGQPAKVRAVVKVPFRLPAQ
jgi:protein TonB